MNKTNKKFKDPGSAITHLIAMIGAVICAFPLIGKSFLPKNRSFHDFRADCRFLHTSLLTGTRQKAGNSTTCPCMGYCNHRHYHKDILY